MRLHLTQRPILSRDNYSFDNSNLVSMHHHVVAIAVVRRERLCIRWEGYACDVVPSMEAPGHYGQPPYQDKKFAFGNPYFTTCDPYPS